MPLSPPPPTLLLGASLFLDFDGTLVEIAERPDAISVGVHLTSLLARLEERLDGRLVLVSGRASADVLAWLKPLELRVAGSHGLEQTGVHPGIVEGLEGGLSKLHDVARRFAGVIVEEKPMGAALHYRQAPEAAEACRTAAHDVALTTGLVVQPGKMVFELKLGTGDKGTAVRAIMAEPLHAGTRPLFIGDDLTDEHGFEAARALGGAAILVGKERTTAAQYRLDDVAAVHAWLRDALELGA